MLINFYKSIERKKCLKKIIDKKEWKKEIK